MTMRKLSFISSIGTLSILLLSIRLAAQPTNSTVKLTQLETAPVAEGTRAGQIGLSNTNGKQRYAQFTEIAPTAIGYVPATTGNTANLSEFVVASDGSRWYIDWQGRGYQFPGGAASVITSGPLQGDGTGGNPVTFDPGTVSGQVWQWNGSAWVLAIPADKNGYYGGNLGNGGDNTIPSSTKSTLTNQLTFEIPTSSPGGMVPVRINVADGADFADWMSMRSGPDSLLFWISDDNINIKASSATDLVLTGGGRVQVVGDSIKLQTVPAAYSQEKTFLSISQNGYVTYKEGISYSDLNQAVKDSLSKNGIYGGDGTIPGSTNARLATSAGSFQFDYSNGNEGLKVDEPNNGIYLTSKNQRSRFSVANGASTWEVDNGGTSVAGITEQFNSINLSVVNPGATNNIFITEDSTTVDKKIVLSNPLLLTTNETLITKKWALDSLPIGDGIYGGDGNVPAGTQATLAAGSSGSFEFDYFGGDPAIKIDQAIDGLGLYSTNSFAGVNITNPQIQATISDGGSNQSFLTLVPTLAALSAVSATQSNSITVDPDSTTCSKKVVLDYTQTSPTAREFITKQWAQANLSGAPAGTDKQTIRYNGTAPVASSALQNNGTEIGVGGAPSVGTALKVYGGMQSTAQSEIQGAGAISATAAAASLKITNTTAVNSWFLGNDNSGDFRQYADGFLVAKNLLAGTYWNMTGGRFGRVPTVTSMFSVADSAASTTQVTIENKLAANTSAASRLSIKVTGSSTGDPDAQFTNGTASYTMGIDNSAAGDPFKISSSSTLGTADFLIASNANVALCGASPTSSAGLLLNGGTISVAPLRIGSGSAVTTPVSGNIEYSGGILSFTNSTPTRLQIQGGFSGSATLDFPSTASTAVSDLTITVTGAALGDPVYLGVPNGSQTATATWDAWVSAANTVTIRYSPKATEDPASGTFNVRVIR